MYFRGYLCSYKYCVRVHWIFRPSRLPLFGEETWTGLHRSSSCGLSSRCNDDLSLRYIRSWIRQGSPTIFFIPSLRKKNFHLCNFYFQTDPSKDYFLYTGETCPATAEPIAVEPRNDTMWISCPKNEDDVPLYSEPDTYLSVALVFTSAVCQRWGLYLFDMIVTQLFQISIPQSKRNRAAAGQYR